MNDETSIPSVLPATLRETPVDQTKRVPANVAKGGGFSPARLFADHAFAARVWFLVACGSLTLNLIQPYFGKKSDGSPEKIVVLDGAGTFSVAPLLGFENASALHREMTLWAVLAMFQRGPKGFDYPEMLQAVYLKDAHAKALADGAQSQAEFDTKNMRQKPEVLSIETLRTSEGRVMVKVEGQLIRTGVFENQTFTEAPQFRLNVTFAVNPNLLTNKRYPLAVWSYDCTIF